MGDYSDTNRKLRNGSVILFVICIILEIVSVACTIAFIAEYDETDSNFPKLAAALIIVGFIGQLVCGGCAICLSKTSEGLEKCGNGCGLLLAMVGLGLSAIWLGILQLVATVLMAIVTADNTAVNVQALGGFTTAINGIISMLSIAYCCIIHGPLLSKIHIRKVEA